jgi:phage terminase small subunit
MAKGGTKAIDGVTEQQKRFAYAYFNNRGNATKAAIKAGYSPKTAVVTGSRLLTYANIQKIIKELGEEIKERAIVTKEQIVAELAKIGFSDIRKLFDEDNRLLNIKDIPDDIAASLSSSEVDQLWEQSENGKVQVGETKKIKLWDKLKALSQLSDIYGYNAPAKVAQTDAEGNNVKTINLNLPSNLSFTLPDNTDGEEDNGEK